MMTTPDAFVVGNSATVGNPALSTFLFAEVGMQPNGLPLTILSVLARLGQDPWAEAARWTKLPRSTTIDKLAGSIAQMPLAPQALAEARQTASRLVLLLPTQLQTPRKQAEVTAKKAAKPMWVLAAIAVVTMALGVATAFVPRANDANGVVPLSKFDSAVGQTPAPAHSPTPAQAAPAATPAPAAVQAPRK
jgi:hypothetical protein